MYKISRTYTFSAAHRIEGHPKCGRLHGHNYKVTVTLSGETLPDDGMLMDFGVLDEVTKPYFDQEFDHRYLVSEQNIDADDPYIESAPQGHICYLLTRTSTAETLAKKFFDELSHRLDTLFLKVCSVSVEETERN